MEENGFLKRFPGLEDQLGKEHAAPLIERFSLRILQDGEVLLRDRSPVDAFYLVLSGGLRLSVEYAGHAISLGEIVSGNWVGELGYFSGVRIASSTATAVGETEVARLAYADFASLMEQDSVASCRLTHGFILMLMLRLEVSTNDPVIDPNGEMLLPGELSLPWSELAQQPHGVIALLKSLLGVH